MSVHYVLHFEKALHNNNATVVFVRVNEKLKSAAELGAGSALRCGCGVVVSVVAVFFIPTGHVGLFCCVGEGK